MLQLLQVTTQKKKKKQDFQNSLVCRFLTSLYIKL